MVSRAGGRCSASAGGELGASDLGVVVAAWVALLRA